MVRGTGPGARRSARPGGGQGTGRARGIEPAAALARAREDRHRRAPFGDGGPERRGAARGGRQRAAGLRPRRRTGGGRPARDAGAGRGAGGPRRAARSARLPRRAPAARGASRGRAARGGPARAEGERVAEGSAVAGQEDGRPREEGGHSLTRACAVRVRGARGRPCVGAASYSSTRTRPSRWRWPGPRGSATAARRPPPTAGRPGPARRGTTTPSERSWSRCGRAWCPGTPRGPPGRARDRSPTASCRRTARRRCR